MAPENAIERGPHDGSGRNRFAPGDWKRFNHIWQPRELSPIERIQHDRMVRAFREEEHSRDWLEEFWRLNQRNPFS